MLDNSPKKPAPNKVRQSIDILTTYRLFVEEGINQADMRQSQQQRSIKYYLEEMQMVHITRTEP